MAKESVGAVVKRRVYGVLFILIVIGLVSLSIAIYAKVFTPTVDVTLYANHTGNELLKDSDVKVNGLIVGTVDDVQANGSDAIVKLALEPDMVSQIPKDVSAQILPKTLFGEQYVSLIRPANSSNAPRIADGDKIEQDRSKGALEAQTVIDHLKMGILMVYDIVSMV